MAACPDVIVLQAEEVDERLWGPQDEPEATEGTDEKRIQVCGTCLPACLPALHVSPPAGFSRCSVAWQGTTQHTGPGSMQLVASSQRPCRMFVYMPCMLQAIGSLSLLLSASPCAPLKLRKG